MDTQQNTSCVCVPIKNCLFLKDLIPESVCSSQFPATQIKSWKRSSVFYVSNCMAETRMIQKRARVISLINVWIPGWQNSAAQLVPCLSMDCRSWNSLFMCPCVTCVHVTFITVVYGPLFCWFVENHFFIVLVWKVHVCPLSLPILHEWQTKQSIGQKAVRLKNPPSILWLYCSKSLTPWHASIPYVLSGFRTYQDDLVCLSMS